MVAHRMAAPQGGGPQGGGQGQGGPQGGGPWSDATRRQWWPTREWSR